MCDDVAKNQAARELVQQAITVRDQPIDRLALWQEFETSA